MKKQKYEQLVSELLKQQAAAAQKPAQKKPAGKANPWRLRIFVALCLLITLVSLGSSLLPKRETQPEGHQGLQQPALLQERVLPSTGLYLNWRDRARNVAGFGRAPFQTPDDCADAARAQASIYTKPTIQFWCSMERGGSQ